MNPHQCSPLRACNDPLVDGQVSRVYHLGCGGVGYTVCQDQPGSFSSLLCNVVQLFSVMLGTGVSFFSPIWYRTV